MTGHMSSALDLEVDEHCRVKGVTGVWVADSSIIPQVTRANTNATAIMIGERVAGWVAGA